jgi:hypothetical protein
MRALRAIRLLRGLWNQQQSLASHPSPLPRAAGPAPFGGGPDYPAPSTLRWAFLGTLALLLLFGVNAPVAAADLKVEAKLIWGTNDEHYANPKKYTHVDEPTAEKLRKYFKWKHYFVVHQQTTNVLSRQTKRLKMSEPCSIDITELPGDRVEVTLFGQGKAVNKSVQPLKKGELLVIGGGDKDDSAWFVIVTQLE